MALAAGCVGKNPGFWEGSSEHVLRGRKGFLEAEEPSQALKYRENVAMWRALQWGRGAESLCRGLARAENLYWAKEEDARI